MEDNWDLSLIIALFLDKKGYFILYLQNINFQFLLDTRERIDKQQVITSLKIPMIVHGITDNSRVGWFHTGALCVQRHNNTVSHRQSTSKLSLCLETFVYPVLELWIGKLQWREYGVPIVTHSRWLCSNLAYIGFQVERNSVLLPTEHKLIFRFNEFRIDFQNPVRPSSLSVRDGNIKYRTLIQKNSIW